MPYPNVQRHISEVQLLSQELINSKLLDYLPVYQANLLIIFPIARVSSVKSSELIIYGGII